MSADGYHLVDHHDVADLRTFVTRAKKLVPDGAIRLTAAGPRLVVTVGVLPGSGVLGEGTVLGMRIMALAGAPDRPDHVVALDAVAERLARMSAEDSLVLAVPPVPRVEAWAGMSPPTSEWVPAADVTSDVLITSATAGIAEISTGAPTGSGAAAVADLRSRVWSRPVNGADGVPAGAAFAAYGLGLLRPGSTVQVRTHHRWVRLSTPAGHVLAR